MALEERRWRTRQARQGIRARNPAVADNSSKSGSPRKKGWRRCRRLYRILRRGSKRRWRVLGLFGASMLILTAFLLCTIAYFERWGEKSVTSQSSLKQSRQTDYPPVSPAVQIPEYFDGKVIPAAFSDYSNAHNLVTANPLTGRYLLYELPNKVSLPHSLMGLTSTFLLAMMTGRALLVRWSPTYEGPGPYDLGGGAVAWSSASNTSTSSSIEDNNTGDASLRSSLEDLFVDPGFWWGWDRFTERWVTEFSLPVANLTYVDVDITAEADALLCSGDLFSWRENDRIVRVTTADYFAPILTLSAQRQTPLPLVDVPVKDTFAYLMNWLLRPVPAVMSAVKKFRERYFDDNYVIGVEISLYESITEWGTLTLQHEELFFTEASDATYRASNSSTGESVVGPGGSRTGGAATSNGKDVGGGMDGSSTNPPTSTVTSPPTGIVILVVTDDEEALRARLAIQKNDMLGAAGIIAITGPRGTGSRRFQTELQELWLLGYAHHCIVSPGSATGAVGHARTSISPVVVVDASTLLPSTSSQPCMPTDMLTTVKSRATCLNKNVGLSDILFDPQVPCKASSRRRRVSHLKFRKQEELLMLVSPHNGVSSTGLYPRYPFGFSSKLQ